MTYHSSYSYRCPSCGTRYAVFREGVVCPRCGYECGDVYPMAQEALRAWKYHVRIYGSGIPPAYAILSLGDFYILVTAKFLTKYFRMEPDDDDAFIEEQLAELKSSERSYLADHFREYFKYVLKLVSGDPLFPRGSL